MIYNEVIVVSNTAAELAELCAGAHRLAEKVTAMVFGAEDRGREAVAYGADEAIVYAAGDGAMPEDYAEMMAQTAAERGVGLVLLTADTRCRLLAGKIAAILKTAVRAGVSSLDEAENGVKTSRMVFGGAAIRTETSAKPAEVITVARGTFSPAEKDAARTGGVTVVNDRPKSGIKRIETRKKTEAVVNLATAKRIVVVGRGFAKEEDLDLGKRLAARIDADLGCSRPVAEGNNWMPKSRYIGVTGAIVKPELCVVIGVSGQVQHLVGINQSKTIVAINKDKDAPIFKNADFGIAGDLYKVLPALLDKLESRA